jgi:hypothetical protein
MHRYEHAERKSLSAGVLRKQNLLRNISSTDWPTSAARNKVWG